MITKNRRRSKNVKSVDSRSYSSKSLPKQPARPMELLVANQFHAGMGKAAKADTTKIKARERTRRSPGTRMERVRNKLKKMGL